MDSNEISYIVVGADEEKTKKILENFLRKVQEFFHILSILILFLKIYNFF